MTTNTLNDYEKIGSNLWKANGKYYRLTGIGITPNGCWIIAPELHQLDDISIVTGQDSYGAEVIKFDITGTVSSAHNYIKR
jgi:hypothetical protein